MADKLGIIAGSGDLPRMLIEACRESGRECHVIALEGHADPDVVKDVPHDWLRLGAAGKAIEIGRALNVRDVVLAGGIERPSLSSLRPDWRTLQFIMRLGRKSLGDDGILRLVIAEFEAEGFRVIGPDTVLQDLKPEAGLLGSHAPDQTAEDDIARGRDVLRSMSAADIGQAVVVQQGLVLGVEAIEGTDALLARCGPLRREGDGGVLVKLSKRGQERRADMPTIGPDTISAAAAAGLRGIAVEANATLVVDRKRTVELANQHGLFLIAVAGE